MGPTWPKALACLAVACCACLACGEREAETTIVPGSEAASATPATPAPPVLRPALHLLDVLELVGHGPSLSAGGYAVIGDVARPVLAHGESRFAAVRCTPQERQTPGATCPVILPRPPYRTDWTLLETALLSHLPDPSQAGRVAADAAADAPPASPPGAVGSRLGQDARAGEDPAARTRFLIDTRDPSIAEHALPAHLTQLLQLRPVAPLVHHDARTPALDIARGSVLRFAIGVEEAGWQVDTAPVRFVIELVAAGRAETVYERVLDPARRPADRGWIEEQVALGERARRGLRLRLTVRPAEPGDPRPQLPLWADPVLLVPADDAPPPSVVLVSLDTLRSRSMSTWGHARETSPRFTTMSADGVLFERAFTTYSNTLASHMSLFTGLYPARHDVILKHDELAAGVTTLPQRMRAAGYVTAAFTEDGMVDGAAGFRRGFGHYDENRRVVESGGDAPGTFGRALDWLRAHPARPFFLFVHTYAVHAPYEPPDAYRSLFAGAETPNPAEALRLRYEQEIRHLDDALAGFLGGVEQLAGRDDLLLVVTSDHGEEFFEHGALSHQQLFEEVLHVPLFVRMPGRLPAGARVATPVSLVDVAPTILDLLGLAGLDGADGRPLPSAAGGGAKSAAVAAVPKRAAAGTGTAAESDAETVAEAGADAERIVFAQSPPSRQTGGRWTFAARDARWKCIVSRDASEAARCFDVERDPREQHPVDPESDERLRRVHAAARRYRERAVAGIDARRPDAAPREIDAEREEKLRALGYVE